MYDLRLIYIGRNDNVHRYLRDNLPGVEAYQAMVVSSVDDLASVTVPGNCHIVVQLDKGVPVIDRAAEVFAAASARRGKPFKAGV